MMLNGTLPQVFAGFLVVETKHERVLLLSSLIIVFDYDQRQLLLLEVKLSDLRPEEKSNLLSTFKH